MIKVVKKFVIIISSNKLDNFSVVTFFCIQFTVHVNKIKCDFYFALNKFAEGGDLLPAIHFITL